MTTLLRRPLLLWTLYLTTVTLIILTFKTLFPGLTSGPGGLSLIQLAGQALLTLLPLPFILKLGWTTVGFNTPKSWKNLHLLIFPLLTIAFGYLAGLQNVDAPHVLTALTLVILVALGEEAAFRGVLFDLLQHLGTWRAVLVSSSLFALMHLPNALLGAPLPLVAIQMLFAGLGGIGYAALRVRTNSLWPGILIHALYDLTFRLANIEPFTLHANLFYALHGVGLVTFAIIVLRRKRLQVTPALA